MASVQAEAPVNDERIEKLTQETDHAVEEKPASIEEAEVVVHEGDADEDEKEEEQQQQIENEVKDENSEEKFAESPIPGDDEPVASFDDEGEAEADVEKGDLI